jgi:hypothetical protein
MVEQFSIAYDAFLEICRRVDNRIDASLGYNTPNSRLLRSCPSCFYKLENEPELEFSSFVSIDGNNSLKRLGTSVRGRLERVDTRNPLSDRWLTSEEVDAFKDEVKGRPVSGCNIFVLPDLIQLRCSLQIMITMTLTTGKMRSIMSREVCDALIGGVMPGLKKKRKCSAYLMSPGYSSHRVAIEWYYLVVI